VRGLEFVTCVTPCAFVNAHRLRFVGCVTG